MEAKDWEKTVMSKEEFDNWYRWFVELFNRNQLDSEKNSIKHLLQAQADISFKAGRDDGVEFCHRQFDANLPEIMETSRLEGIREVVELIDGLIIGIEHCKFEERLDGDKGCIVLDMNENQWEAQKKEWGIENGKTA